MRHKSKRILTILGSACLAALLLVGLLAGCGARSHKSAQFADMLGVPGSMYYEEYTQAQTTMYYGNVAYENAIDYDMEAETKEADIGGNATTYSLRGRGMDGAQDDRFVILRASYSIQTKTYDAFVAALNAALKDMGGYTNSFEESNYDSDRYASIVARVPSEKLDAFLESLEKNGTVTNRRRDRSDVTDEMIETGSKKEALKNEEAALLDILKKAQNVEDIIRVQDRLSNVRAELQAYSQKLQSLQNQVNYSTVNIDVWEVNRITTPTQKFSALASSGFLGSLRDIGSGLRNFALWFVEAIPYLVMLAVPAAILIWFLRRARKNRRAKKAAKSA